MKCFQAGVEKGVDISEKTVIISNVAEIQQNKLQRWLSWSKAHDWKSCNG